MNRLNGKTAVITGGATGIGRAAAKRFVEEGAFVFIFGRRQEALGEDGLKAYGSMTALQRMGDPEEVGAAAAFLASSDSSFMTGSEVAVDGGLAQL